MGKIKAILFDLNGTLVYNENPVTEMEISEYLFDRGYAVSPQQLDAAWSFVSFVDYPKYGYRNWHTYLSRILWRLKVRVDEKTLDAIVRLLETRSYQLYPDAAEAAVAAKRNGFKTAIVTTIAHFKFRKAIRPIRRYLDFVMTGHEAGCDKSNPKMYRTVLEILKVKPHEAVMIGDEIPLDILLPRKLGMNAILLDRKHEKTGQTVDASVYDLNEAMEMVIKMLSRGENSSKE